MLFTYLMLLTNGIDLECNSKCRATNIAFAKKHGAHYARRYNVPVSLVYAVIRTESNWNPNAVSRVGAIGYMQLMPNTARYLGANPYSPRENVRAGVFYLARLLEIFEGKKALALSAYNAGPALVRRLGRIPKIDETQKYVRAVLRREEMFR